MNFINRFDFTAFIITLSLMVSLGERKAHVTIQTYLDCNLEAVLTPTKSFT